MELKSKDYEILYELSLNARLSNTQLAKQTNLSKQALAYRLQNLETNKIIEGYYPITNIYRLGKTHYRIFAKYQNMSLKKEEELLKYLVENPNISWIASVEGDYDIAFLIWAENIIEFEKTFDKINEKFGKFFYKKVFSIGTKIEYLKYRYLFDKKETKTLTFGGVYSNETLDLLERKVLNELNLNGRTSLVEIAKKTKTYPKIVRSKIQQLIKKNIIIGFNVKINHRLLGFTHRKIFLMLNNNSKSALNSIENYLRAQSQTIYIVKPIGEFDLEFEVMTKDNDELRNIVKELRTKFSEEIKNFEMVTLYYEIKSGQYTKF